MYLGASINLGPMLGPCMKDPIFFLGACLVSLIVGNSHLESLLAQNIRHHTPKRCMCRMDSGVVLRPFN